MSIPFSFLTDRRTVFEYKRKNTLMDEDDTFTQFSYACNQLGIEIKTTSVARAKGRVERMNQTLQSRLPIELRRAHITTIDQAMTDNEGAVLRGSDYYGGANNE